MRKAGGDVLECLLGDKINNGNLMLIAFSGKTEAVQTERNRTSGRIEYNGN